MVWHFCALYLFFRQAVGNVTNARVNLFVTIQARFVTETVLLLWSGYRLAIAAFWSKFCCCWQNIFILCMLVRTQYFVHACRMQHRVTTIVHGAGQVQHTTYVIQQNPACSISVPAVS